MREYCIVTDDTKVKNVILELTGILDYQLSDNGTKVTVIKQGTGITVSKQGGCWNIRYGSDSELARAWYLMYRNDDKQTVSVSEELVFDDLGVMLDCSRNAVMNVTALKEYIKQLALLGYHTLELYTEDTMKVEGEPYMGYMRGAYTSEEIKEIDSYCKIFGIELVPCIQTLAHINQITRYEHYSQFIDVNDILLVGDARTYDLIEHIIAAAAKNFTSRRINIGMDEAHMLGLGKYLDEHGYQDRFRIILNHLNKVLEILHKYGFKPQMWSDMFFRLLGKGSYTLTSNQIDQSLFDLVPKDVELMYWDYYSFDYDHYDHNLKNHYKITNRVGFAAGAWKWTGFAPDNKFSQCAGAKAIKACIANHVSNFLVTCWGDNGAEASAFSVLPTLYFYAESAYGAIGREIQPGYGEYQQNYKVLTGLTFEESMSLDAPNQVFDVTDYEHGNACKYLLYNDPLIGTFDSLVTPVTAKRFLEIASELSQQAKKQTRYSYLFETLSSLCYLLNLKADLGVKIKSAYDQEDKEELKIIALETIPEIIDRLDEFLKKFRYQWHKENKSFGFEIQLIRLGGLKERLSYVKDQLLAYAEGELFCIEELKDDRLPLAYTKQQDPCKVNYNFWSAIASPSVMG